MFIKLSEEYYSSETRTAGFLAVDAIRSIEVGHHRDSLYEYKRLIANIGDDETYDLYHSDKYHVSDWEGYENIDEYHAAADFAEEKCWLVFAEIRKLMALGDGFDIDHIVGTMWKKV